MSKSSLALKIVLALIGCIAGAYVGQELLKGGAIGWSVTVAIVVALAWPLFHTLLAWRNGQS